MQDWPRTHTVPTYTPRRLHSNHLLLTHFGLDHRRKNTIHLLILSAGLATHRLECTCNCCLLGVMEDLENLSSPSYTLSLVSESQSEGQVLIRR